MGMTRRFPVPAGATAAAACLAAVLTVACAAHAPRVPRGSATAAVPFSQVDQIFRDSCEHCHNADDEKGGLLMDSYASLVAGGEHGNALVPGDSDASRLVQMIEGRLKPRMPYKEDPLAREQVALIRRWIDEGAAGPEVDGEPAAVRREVEIPDVKPLVPATGAVAALAFDPLTRRIAVGTYRSVHLMALADRKWVAALNDHADLIRAVAFSPDGSRLAAAGGPSGRYGEIKIWDVSVSVPKLVSTIQGHRDSILAIAFSPDGRTIASGSYDKLIKLWTVADGKVIGTLKEHSDAVYAVAFLPGGTQLLSAAGDRTVKVWDVSAGKRLFTVNDSLDAVYTAGVHPSGRWFAAAGADRMIRTWAWNGDASAAGGNTATLQASTFAHGESVLRLAYSPDGAILASAGADRVIKVWDAATLKEKQAFEPQPDWVMGLALSADGKWLAAGRYDGTLGLYGLDGGRSGEQFVVPR
jgi:WD40 repeat protein/mono/diheme cytochrome c family protein